MTDTLGHLVEAAEQEFIEEWTRGPSRTSWEVLPPQIGDTAPEATLADHTGAQTDLSALWAEQPALLLFWRHFGCGCGLDRAARLRDEHDDYIAAGANVAIIGQGEPERAAAYRDQQDLAVPILCDPDRDLYRAYGLREGGVPHMLFDAPQEMWDHDRATGEEFQRQRRDDGRPLVDSPWQLPGEFVVDTSGAIKLDWRYQYCEDYPNPLVLIAAIKAA